MTSQRLASLRNELFVLLFFLSTWVVLTFPVALHFDRLPGDNRDNLLWTWQIGWLERSILTHSSFLHDPNVFYPVGIDLFSFNFSLNCLLAFPFALFYGPVFAYNVIFALSFVLSGYTMYRLVCYFTRNSLAGVLSGLIYGFSPYRMAHGLGHFEIIGTFWIPLFVLYLHKTMTGKKRSDAIVAAIFFVLTALTSGYYAAIASVLLVVLVVAAFLASRLRFQFTRSKWSVWLSVPSATEVKRYFRLALVFSLLCFIVLLPYAVYVGNKAPKRTVEESVRYSADPIDYVTPNFLSPDFGQIAYKLRPQIYDAAEHNLYLGAITLVLSFYALAKVRRRAVKTYAIVAIAFFVLSLGPILHFLDKPVMLAGHYVLMPYILLSNLPFFLSMRAVSRFGLVVILSACVIAGIGIADLTRRIDLQEKKVKRALRESNLIVFLFIAIIMLEFSSIPYPTTNTYIAAYDWLSKQTGDFAIIEYPVSNLDYSSTYGTIIHGKKTVSGFAEIAPWIIYPDAKWPFKVTSLLNALAFFQPDGNGRFSRQVDMHLYDSLNIRYVLFRTSDYVRTFGSDAWNRACDLIRRTENMLYVGDFGGILVYQVLGNAGLSPFAIFAGDHWYDPEIWSDNQTWRWMSNNASLIIFNPLSTPMPIRLKFFAVSFAKQRTLHVYLNGNLLNTLLIMPNMGKLYVNSPLCVEANSVAIISLYMPEGAESSATLGTGSEHRMLSIALQNIGVLLE